jgi:hypothetical protein
MDNYVNLQNDYYTSKLFSEMKGQLFVMIMLLVGLLASAQEYQIVKEISFTVKSDAYAQERLKLKSKSYVVIGANYCLFPKVAIDKTLDDSAEAVACLLAEQNYKS